MFSYMYLYTFLNDKGNLEENIPNQMCNNQMLIAFVFGG